MKKKSHPLTLRGIPMNDQPFSPRPHEAKFFPAQYLEHH
jgi:hypothetical protein